jgi:hypothetical protein
MGMALEVLHGRGAADHLDLADIERARAYD